MNPEQFNAELETKIKLIEKPAEMKTSELLGEWATWSATGMLIEEQISDVQRALDASGPDVDLKQRAALQKTIDHLRKYAKIAPALGPEIDRRFPKVTT